MGIRDYKCEYGRYTDLEDFDLSNKGIVFPEAYVESDEIIKLAKVIKEENARSFHIQPFCHTLEGEALGGDIKLGSSRIGPRAGGYIYSSLEDLISIPDYNYKSGRLSQTLIAASRLAEEEKLIFNISGPMTVLSLLLEAQVLYKGFRKQPELMIEILSILKERTLSLITELKSIGIRYISYADPVGGLSILGPKLFSEVMVHYTYPLLKQAGELIDDDMVMILCPKISLGLLDLGMAKWHDIAFKKDMTYQEACFEVVGKAKFVGQTCINHEGPILRQGMMKSIRLLGVEVFYEM